MANRCVFSTCWIAIRKIHALYWLIYNILLLGRYGRRYGSRINKAVACVP